MENLVFQAMVEGQEPDASEPTAAHVAAAAGVPTVEDVPARPDPWWQAYVSDTSDAPRAFSAATACDYSHWTDDELYRAIDNPETPRWNDHAVNAEITSYVDELRRRKRQREDDAARRERIQREWGIVDDSHLQP